MTRPKRRIALARLLTTLLLTFFTVAPATLYGQRRVGTIGPPPRKNPQRQTSAEGFPPLPLPVTPLRRSEPKAEPAPPLFMAKLIYGKDQDYMPNPGL